MPAKWDPPNIDDLIKLYASPATIKDIARQYGIGYPILSRFAKANAIAKARIARPERRAKIDASRVVAALHAGQSVLAIATAEGVSRSAIGRVLREAGVAVPNRSEGMYRRMAQTTPEYRLSLSQAAHDAARGRTHTWKERALRAKTNESVQSRRSAYEETLADLLRAKGEVVAQQTAVGIYNCDITIPGVAVEVFGGNWHFSGTHAARTPKRIRYLFDAGLSVIMVVVGPKHPITEVTADHVIAFAKETRRDPSAPRQYRVIRGAGEFFTAGSAEDDKIAIVWPRAGRRDPLTGRYYGVAR